MEKLRITPGQAASSAPSTEQSQKLNSKKTLVLRCQRIIFSAFRADQYSDPDGYLTSLGLVLEQYPSDVIVYISDPRTGVQRRCKWPPTISEIVEACDDRVSELKRNERYRNWGKNDSTLLLDGPQIPRPTLEEIKLKYGPNYGLTANEPPRESTFKAPSWDAITEAYAADPSRLAHLTKAADEQH
jgi:hypothetical protein